MSAASSLAHGRSWPASALSVQRSLSASSASWPAAARQRQDEGRATQSAQSPLCSPSLATAAALIAFLHSLKSRVREQRKCEHAGPSKAWAAAVRARARATRMMGHHGRLLRLHSLLVLLDHCLSPVHLPPLTPSSAASSDHRPSLRPPPWQKACWPACAHPRSPPRVRRRARGAAARATLTATKLQVRRERNQVVCAPLEHKDPPTLSAA